MSAPTDVALADLAGFRLPALSEAGDKDGRGRVLAVGGGSQVPGALILTGLAALRAGAGKLRLATTSSVAVALGVAVPESAVLGLLETPEGEISADAAVRLCDAVSQSDAVVLGPGMIDPQSAGALAARMMMAAKGAAFVLDAAAMTGVDLDGDGIRNLAGRLVLTPHAGEMAKLTGFEKERVESDPVSAARSIARTSRAVVIMKGAETFIVSPDGRAWRHQDGVIGLATSGSGDVLAGIIGGLLARGAPPLTAAVWAVCVHGACGARLTEKMGTVGLIARELLDEIPRVFADA